MRVFENRVLRRIFGHKCNEETKKAGEKLNKEPLPNIFKMKKPRSIR
jgi:hypothetical protein